MRQQLLGLLACAAAVAHAAVSEDRLAAIKHLKETLHTMTAEEATAAFAEVRGPV